MARTRWGKKMKNSQKETGGGSDDRDKERSVDGEGVTPEVVEKQTPAAEEDEERGVEREGSPVGGMNEEDDGEREGLQTIAEEDGEREQSPPVGGRTEEYDGEREGSPADEEDGEREQFPVGGRTGEESVSLGTSEEEENESEEEESEEGEEEKDETVAGKDDGGVRPNEEEVNTVAEEGAEGSEGSSSRTVSDSMGGDGYSPLQPLSMYFAPSEYNKKIKLATRCYIYEALKTLDELEHPLTAFERKWFEEHPQFKHIFHMPLDRNHKVMGMWMLLLRTACLEKKK